MRRPMPNALLVTLMPGAACRRLYSLTLISRRLEGYLRAHTEEAFSDDDEVDLFLECIADVVTAGEEPADDLLETILESLPAPVCD